METDALDVAARLALQDVATWKKITDSLDGQQGTARTRLAESVNYALTLAPKDQVAQAAGVTPSAMYKSLRKVYGPRKGGTE